LFLAACAGGPDAPQPNPPVQHDVTESGVVDHALDPATTAGPARDGWVELAGGQVASFVPAGHAIDTSRYHFGRGDLEYPHARTPVGVELTGLRAWQTGDTLELVSPGVGLAIAGLDVHLRPAANATAITGQELDWAGVDSPLIDAGRGDSTWIAQLAYRTGANGEYYNVLERAGRADGFALRDGVASQLRAELAPVAADRALPLRWRGSEFARLAAQAGPGTRMSATPALSLRTLPTVLASHGDYFSHAYTYLPSLVEFGPIRGGDDFDETIRYGNPFASSAPWTDFVTMIYAMPVSVAGAGATHALAIQAMPVDALAHGAAFAPAISPVRDVRIDGQPLDTAQRSPATAPTISWSAPELGTATNYKVTVQAVHRDRQSVGFTTVASFTTTATSLALPASALAGVASYALTITAISLPARDLASAPFDGGLPFASIDYVTALVTR
jgi:hypothetical protein